MEIKHLKHNEIDFEKYDACIKNAINSRVYAYSWYLDVVCNKDWEVLVLDDYKIVMPLPFKRIKRKFLKRMIVQPLFCQQLGVFYKSEISLNQFDLFIKKFNSFNNNTYNFNANNTVFLEDKTKYKLGVNYELNLNKPFEEIQKNYSKNLKRNIKKGVKNELVIDTNFDKTGYKLIQDNNKKHKLSNKQYNRIIKLIEKINDQKLGKLFLVKKEKNIIAIAFFIISKKRIVHLFSASNPFGKQYGAIPYLFDTIIKNNAHKNVIFDFEGSIIPGVATFYKSFGSDNVPYLQYTKTLSL